MEIADADILACTEITMDFEVLNARYVELHDGDRLIRRIRVAHKQDAIVLAQQLYEYKEKLHEDEKISARRD